MTNNKRIMNIESVNTIFWGCILFFLAIGGPVQAIGPTSVDPVCWQKAGVGLTFDAGHSTWVTGWTDASGHGQHLHKRSSSGNPLYRPNTLTHISHL